MNVAPSWKDPSAYEDLLVGRLAGGKSAGVPPKP